MSFYTLYALIRDTSPEDAEASVDIELTEKGLCIQSRYAHGSCDFFRIEAGSAHLVTKEEYERLLEPYEGEQEVWEECRLGKLLVTDCDLEPISPSVIGTKYIVPVHCHN